MKTTFNSRPIRRFEPRKLEPNQVWENENGLLVKVESIRTERREQLSVIYTNESGVLFTSGVGAFLRDFDFVGWCD